MDYRIVKNRTKAFLRWYAWSLHYKDCDPPIWLLNYLFNRYEHNIEQRLSQLNTGCPGRLYYVVYKVYQDDCHEAERKAHELANNYGDILKGEWFKITEEQALEVLQELTLDN